MRDSAGEQSQHAEQAPRLVRHARAIDGEVIGQLEAVVRLLGATTGQHGYVLDWPALPQARQVRFGLGGIGQKGEGEGHTAHGVEEITKVRVVVEPVTGDVMDKLKCRLGRQRFGLDGSMPGRYAERPLLTAQGDDQRDASLAQEPQQFLHLRPVRLPRGLEVVESQRHGVLTKPDQQQGLHVGNRRQADRAADLGHEGRA